MVESLTCFHLTIFFGEEKFSKLSSKNKVADEKKLVQSGKFSSATFFWRQRTEFFFSKKFVKWKHISIRSTQPIQLLRYYNPLNFKWFTLPILQFLQACRWPLLKIWPSVHPRPNPDPNIDLIPLYQYSHHTRESQLWINCKTLRYWFW